MIVYQVVVFEAIASFNADDRMPEMRTYEMFQNRDNAKALIPSAIAHYRQLYDLSEDTEVHSVIEDFEIVDMPNEPYALGTFDDRDDGDWEY